MAARREQGAALVSVLLLVLVASILVVGMMSVSIASTRAVATNVFETQALADARTGILAAYKQLVEQWQYLGGNGAFTSVSAAQTALDSLKQAMTDWQAHTGLPANIQVSLQWQDITSGDSGPIGKVVTIEATGRDGTVSENLQSTTAVTATPEALNYALYSTGDLVVAGGVDVNGNAAVAGNLYFSTTPWVPNLDLNYGEQGQTWLQVPLFNFLDFVKATAGVVHVQESTSGTSPDEPTVPMTIQGEAIYVGGNLYTYTGYSDMNLHAAYTTRFGDTSVMSAAAMGTESVSQYIHGLPIYAPVRPEFSTDAAQIVNNAKSSIYNQTKNVPGNMLYLLTGTLQGYYGQTVSLKLLDLLGQSQYYLTGLTYIEGDLDIPSSAVLYVNYPLYVSGDLISRGTIIATAPIYVGGSAYYEPIDLFQQPNLLQLLNPAKDPPRLMIIAANNIVMTLQPWGSELLGWSKLISLPSSPVTVHAYLLAGQTVYLDGTTGDWNLLGGVVGKNVILTAANGQKQSWVSIGSDDRGWPLYKLRSRNLTDSSPRLTITYDPGYAMMPLTGTTMLQFTVQPLSPPQRVTG